MQGHNYSTKQWLAHNTSVARRQSREIVVKTDTIFSFQPYSNNVTQPNLQSSEKLVRENYVQPLKEMKLNPNHLIHLLKPLHGLPESVDSWGRTFRKRIEKHI